MFELFKECASLKEQLTSTHAELEKASKHEATGKPKVMDTKGSGAK